MTKEWESYTQMVSNAGLTAPIPEISYSAMSDAEEIMRSTGGRDSLGEVLVDYSDDLRELGLI